MSARLAALVVLCALASGCAHTIEVNSEPPGAAVYVDGEHVGETPLSLERQTSHADVVTLAVQRGGREARVAVLENGWAWEAIVVGFGAMGATVLAGMAAAVTGYVGVIGGALFAGTFGPAAIIVILAAVALMYGGVLASSFAIFLPFVAAGEFGRRGPDEVWVDFREGLVTTSPAGHAQPLIGTSPGHLPLKPRKRSRDEERQRPVPEEEPLPEDPLPEERLPEDPPLPPAPLLEE